MTFAEPVIVSPLYVAERRVIYEVHSNKGEIILQEK